MFFRSTVRPAVPPVRRAPLPPPPIAFADLCRELGVPAPPTARGIYVFESPWPGLTRCCIVGNDGALLLDGLIATHLVTEQQRARWEAMLSLGAPLPDAPAPEPPGRARVLALLRPVS